MEGDGIDPDPGQGAKTITAQNTKIKQPNQLLKPKDVAALVAIPPLPTSSPSFLFWLPVLLQFARSVLACG